MARDNQEGQATPDGCILVTGGAGYIGSHSVFLLLKQAYKVVVIDNCSCGVEYTLDSNGNLDSLPESLRRVQILANRNLESFYGIDLKHQGDIDRVFQLHNIKAVIHFAALKSVSDSIRTPLEYYTNNLIGSINLLNSMKRHGCRQLIFSSSATVYGVPQYLPVDEQHPINMNILNPYGHTKCMIEQILSDLTKKPEPAVETDNSGSLSRQLKQPHLQIISLRYFNPVGAHPSGLIGEHTEGSPNNLMPFISQVAVGKRAKVSVFGKDFDTIDGTGVRDYIHIMDLASAHTHALSYLVQMGSQNGSLYKAYNVGTGRGYSVLELIGAFERVNNVRVPHEIVGRRAGDAAEVYADVRLINEELGWVAKLNLTDMVRDTFNWQKLYPEGFKTPAKDIIAP